MELHSFFGKEKSDRLLEKIINRVINAYLRNATTIDDDINFSVKTRHGNSDDLGSWVVQIYTDKPIPNSFKYNDEYKKNKNTMVDGIHISVLKREIKNLIRNMGIDINSFGNIVEIKFMNTDNN